MKKYIFAILIAAAASATPRAAHAQLIIANPSVKASSASKSELKEVFTGGASELGGSHVTPVLLKAGAVHDEFLAAYIGKADTAFRTSWRSLVLSGQTTMPKSVDSDAAMVEFVAHTPGAIGYIGKASPHEGVKVITAN